MNKYFVQETKCYSTEPLWNGKQMQVYFYLLSPADPGVERCDLPQKAKCFQCMEFFPHSFQYSELCTHFPLDSVKVAGRTHINVLGILCSN